MDHPPGSVPAQRRTTLVAFLILLIAVMVINVTHGLALCACRDHGRHPRGPCAAGLSVAHGPSRPTASGCRRGRARGGPGDHCAARVLCDQGDSAGHRHRARPRRRRRLRALPPGPRQRVGAHRDADWQSRRVRDPGPSLDAKCRDECDRDDRGPGGAPAQPRLAIGAGVHCLLLSAGRWAPGCSAG